MTLFGVKMGLSFPPALLSVLVLSLAAFGCDSSSRPPEEEVASEGVPSVLILTDRRATTRADIAVSNLNAQIDAASEVFAISRDRSTRERLFELLSVRVQFLGSYSDFEVLGALGEQAAQDDNVDARLLEARSLLLIHEFSGAQERLSRLRAAGVDVDGVQLTLDLALHQNLDSALAESEERASRTPSFETYSARASVLLTVGRFDEADAAFQHAEDVYKDVSPFPLAWLAFQRGLMWSERADMPELGLVYYRRALEYLPQFVVANVHRAELESDRREVLSLLETAALGEDPEPRGKLASYWDSADPHRAEEYRKQATSGYDELLRIYPLAFVDHASEYFRGPGGDAERALSLALMNLENRETPRSLLLAWAAAESAGDLDTLCSLIERGRGFDASHPVLAKERRAKEQDCSS